MTTYCYVDERTINLFSGSESLEGGGDGGGHPKVLGNTRWDLTLLMVSVTMMMMMVLA